MKTKSQIIYPTRQASAIPAFAWSSFEQEGMMIHGLYFGARIIYISPMDGHKTPCVYIRDDGNRAVVIFRHAENVARVDLKQLAWW
ncbi:MAG: hypothetical protein NC548_56445 [Lachnospiraceae bacterium]|nr:hypothetical protein [Lachnospiraceae bacterium]MCM1232424.1 hypothetical protein [Ruminococcus flavefaciens]